MNTTDLINSILTSMNVKKAFQITSLKHSVEFTEAEYFKTFHWLSLSNQKVEGSVKLYWNDALGKDAIAAFSALKPNAIFVSKDFRFSIDSDGFKKLIAPIAHELRHRKQYEVLKMFYFLLAIPIVRTISLEVDANRTTKYVNDIYNIPEDEWL